jgi:hypothetical protein
LRLNLSKWNLWVVCLLTASLSLTFATTRQWSVSQSAALIDRISSVLKCHLVVYQNMVNFYSLWYTTGCKPWRWSMWLCVFPSWGVQQNLWKLRCESIVILTLRFLDLANFTSLTPLPLLISCKLSFPIVSLNMSFLCTSGIHIS